MVEGQVNALMHRLISCISDLDYNKGAKRSGEREGD